MRLLFFILTTFCLRADSFDGGTCYGYVNCTTCKNCNYCKHCNSGGACGVCSGSSRKTVHTERSTGKNRTTPSSMPLYREPSYLPRAAVVEAEKLNVRTGPGTHHDVLITLYKGMDLEIVDTTFGDWVGVRGLVTIDGTTYRYEGYVYKLYLRF